MIYPWGRKFLFSQFILNCLFIRVDKCKKKKKIISEVYNLEVRLKSKFAPFEK